MEYTQVLREQIKESVDKADEKTLEVVQKILEAFEPDPLENLSEEASASLHRSLRQASEGLFIPHEEVRKEYEKWITK